MKLKTSKIALDVVHRHEGKVNMHMDEKPQIQYTVYLCELVFIS